MGQKYEQHGNKSVLEPIVPKDVAARSQRGRILDAMAACCAEKTFASTTISDIVNRARVSRATFYKQFGDKRGCFDAAVDYILDELRVVAVAARSDTASEPENVREAIAAGLKLMTAAPTYTRLIVVEAIAVDPSLIDRFRNHLIETLRASRSGAEGARASNSSIRVAYGQAQMLIANQLLSGDGDALSDLLPDLVYIALHPFAGPEEALRQARLAR
jgi:AcrR family transcriptional regulator